MSSWVIVIDQIGDPLSPSRYEIHALRFEGFCYFIVETETSTVEYVFYLFVRCGNPKYRPIISVILAKNCL